MIDGVLVKWGRGEYPVSIRFMSQRWNWSTHKVRIFINLLKSEGQAAQRTARRATILTLCKYDYYNPISQANVQGEGQAGGTVAAQSIRIEEDKEDKGLKENLLKEKTEEGKAYNEIDFASIPKNEDTDLTFLDNY